MHHDKKTTLKHQDILVRRGFNIPDASVLLVDEEQSGKESTGTKASAKTKKPNSKS